MRISLNGHELKLFRSQLRIQTHTTGSIIVEGLRIINRMAPYPATKMPFYIKLSQLTIGIVAFFFVLYVGQTIILPLIYAGIFATLLNPMVNFLHRKGIYRIIAILIAVFISFLVIAGIIYFIAAQASMVSNSFPEFQEKFTVFLNEMVSRISNTFHIPKEKLQGLLKDTQSEFNENSSAYVGKTLTTVTGVLIVVLLVPVYIFLILLYKSLLLEFISKLFSKETHGDVADVLMETQVLIQSYLKGLLIEAAIIAVLNSVGLFIIGIPYAIILGVMGALLNLIPYIGGIIGTAIPMVVALAIGSPTQALLVLGLFLLVQFIDNNYIVPGIVASRVQLNALVSLVAIFVGNALWGIPGAFLAIPLTAVTKVIFDRIVPLKPWGFLLGDNIPPISKTIFHFNRVRGRKN